MRWFKRGNVCSQTVTTGSNSTMCMINGVSYSGSSISVVNGMVTIDGKSVKDEGKTINIQITGNVKDLSVDCCNKVDITGDVAKVSTVSGDIKCGNVTGNVETVSGDVSCKSVGGDVSTVSGDVAGVGM